MMKFYGFKTFFVFVFCFLIFNSGGNNRVFFIDQLNGNDSNTGTSSGSAWASISKLNDIEIQPGDSILFLGGQVFQGTIHLKNWKGIAEKGILISSYGEGFATISGGYSEAFIADSCSYIEIKNLYFSGDGRKNGNTTSGVIISNSQNISVDSVKVSGFQKAGIKVADSQNIRITRVHAYENGFAGILTGEAHNVPFRLLSKNIYIGYCTSENNPGDPTILNNHSGSGILISGADSVVVEFCLAKNNGWDQPWEGNGPIGIWAYHSNNVIIQHCIAHSNKTNPKGVDGGGFDFDGGVTNSVMQYNLSYRNMGPGFGLYQYSGAEKWENNIIRYNISINDGTEIDSCGLQIWNGQPEGPEMKNALIYNNVFYSDFGRAVNYKNGDIPGLYYANNVFVSRLQPINGVHTKSVFENNLYWRKFNLDVQFTDDSLAVFANPKFTIPNILNYKLEDPSSLKNLDLFKPQPDSPLIGKGIPVANNGGFDFGGNPLPADSTGLNVGIWQGEIK
jgi:hypothetical protein